MVNLDNQRPGDVWMLGKTRYEVEAVEQQGPNLILKCRRHTAHGTEPATISILTHPRLVLVGGAEGTAELRTWRAALLAGYDEAWAPTMLTWRVRQLFEAAGIPLDPPVDEVRGDCSACGRTNVLASDTCPAFMAELGGPHTAWRPGIPEYRSLLDALLEDAEEHRAAGRVMQAANAFAAVENLRTMPPWQPSIADVAPMVSGGPPATAEDDIEEGGW